MIWPFSNRRGGRGAKLKSATAKQAEVPAPEQSLPTESAGVSRRLSKRRSQRRRRTSPKPKPFTAIDETAATQEESSAPPASLEPIRPTTPMDVTYQPRPSTGGSLRAEAITALPNSRQLRTSPHLRPVTQDAADIPYNWNLGTTSHHVPAPQPNARKPSKLQRNPKRAAYDSPVARRRSSKKRKDDHLREEEIRAMSQPLSVPKRGIAGDTGILRKESRKHRGGLNRNLERPVSTISLPLEDSIHSSMSGNSNPRPYRLSVLNIMSPRPAIRLADTTNKHSNRTESSTLIRKASVRVERQRLQKQQSSKEMERDMARIDSLADELDSTELRDIMDRDRRRREKKREKDANHLKRKLERRAEKQRTKEWATRDREDVDSDRDTIVPDAPEAEPAIGKGKDKFIDAIEEPTFHMDDIHESNDGPFSDAHETQEPQVPTLQIPIQEAHVEEIPRMPLLSSHGDSDERREIATPFSDIATPFSDLESPIEQGTAQAIPYASRPLSPVTSTLYHGDRFKASRLLGTDVSVGGGYTRDNTILDNPTRPQENVQLYSTPSREEPSRIEPETAEPKKKVGMFASLFKSRRRSVVEPPRDKISAEPSFSNTSREEMSRNIPAHLVAPTPVTSIATSAPRTAGMAGSILRTTSKFREDLPESPLAAPESRIQSPIEPGSAAGTTNFASRQIYSAPSTINTDTSSTHRVGSPDADAAARRPESPLSGRRSALMSQSLASVDSEASWLSGRPRKTSAARKHNSGGGGSTRPGDFSASYEELEIPEDEYFKRLNTPQGHPAHSSSLSAGLAVSHKASSTAIGHGASDVEDPANNPAQEEGQITAHAGASRHPTLIQREHRVKSSEGLLKHYLEDDTVGGADENKTPEAKYPSPAITPTDEKSRSSEEITPVQRATSINVGKGHARNISAGSAKLLDIARRGSTSSQPSTPNRSKFSLKEDTSPLDDKVEE